MENGKWKMAERARPETTRLQKARPRQIRVQNRAAAAGLTSVRCQRDASNSSHDHQRSRWQEQKYQLASFSNDSADYCDEYVGRLQAFGRFFVVVDWPGDLLRDFSGPDPVSPDLWSHSSNRKII